MNISLRADEKLYINGAVIKVDRKVTIGLLNDATFLLENHVLQARDATTPLRQIYFAVQVILMDPASASEALGLSRELIKGAQSAFDSPEILRGLVTVSSLVELNRPLEALKLLRSLFQLEQEIMFPAQSVKQVA